MPNVKVKICGITNWADAQRAMNAGAALLGFNFYAKSPRYIAPGKARQIVRRLPRQHRAQVEVLVAAERARALAGELGALLERARVAGVRGGGLGRGGYAGALCVAW